MTLFSGNGVRRQLYTCCNQCPGLEVPMVLSAKGYGTHVIVQALSDLLIARLFPHQNFL